MVSLGRADQDNLTSSTSTARSPAPPPSGRGWPASGAARARSASRLRPDEWNIRQAQRSLLGSTIKQFVCQSKTTRVPPLTWVCRTALSADFDTQQLRALPGCSSRGLGAGDGEMDAKALCKWRRQGDAARSGATGARRLRLKPRPIPDAIGVHRANTLALRELASTTAAA